MTSFASSPITPPWNAKSAETAVALSVAPGVEASVEPVVGATAVAPEPVGGGGGGAAEGVLGATIVVLVVGPADEDVWADTAPPPAAALPPDFGGSGARVPVRSMLILLKMPRDRSSDSTASRVACVCSSV